MANFNFQNIGLELEKAREEGLTFEDKQETWDTADDVKAVVDGLENTKLVHFLKLEGNTLGVDAAAAIGKALQGHSEFRKALWRNMFTRRLKTEIPQALKHLGDGLIIANAHLAVLDLSDNALGPNGMVGLEVLLRSQVCYSLQELRLNNCGLGIDGGKMLSNAILDCHRTSCDAGIPLQLKVFVTGRNRLENEGAMAIAKIFTALKSLEEIAMPQNFIYHEGIAALAEGFKENQNLRILNLNDNTVTHKGAAHLADAFKFTPHLQEINLGDCLLKTNGAYHIAEALEENHQELQVVDLSFNDIGSDAGLVLVSAMQNKVNLKRLNIDGNMFGFDGRENIKEAMLGAANPDALESLDNDEEENEEDDEDEEVSEEDEEDDMYGEEHHNDTTEEADEYEDYQDENEDGEDTAYTTTQDFTTKLRSTNESLSSNKSTTFGAPLEAAKIESNTAESFCLSQKPYTLEMFQSLKEDDKIKAFEGVINQFTGDNYLLVLIFTTLKCAHLAQSSNDALELATALFKKCCDHAVTTNQERRVLNYLLIQLGLLRSEVKFNSPYNLKSCRFALRETLKTQDLPSDYMKNTFNIFLKNLD